MSDVLFPHTRLSPGALRLRLAAVGGLGALALTLLIGMLGLQTLGVLSGDYRLTVQLPVVGDTLGTSSDVKYNGLRVGRVVEVDPVARPGETGWDGPTATVLVDPDHAAAIPSGVVARVLPGTLFGNEYVDLVVPDAPAPAVRPAAAGAGRAHLADGDVVPADTSRATLRLMDTFEATQRLLGAVDPAQWDVALSQLAAALEGRGTRIAEMIRDGDAFVGRWTELRPQVQRDLDLLTTDARLAGDVEPQLIAALKDTRPLTRALVEQERELRTLLTALPELLDGKDGVTAFLRANGALSARLLNATAANLEVFAARHPSFALMLQKVPQLLRNGAAAVKGGRIQMEGVIAPQLLDPYDSADPADCPTYRGLRGACGGAR
ncbi:MCE family protein [Nocardioides sp. zg-536]|uniref:MCE family protein n=1 Tax=Nocardioides faecalis TaxID=2803858 RepID=A0A938Y4X9_9ACTN|nr:MCE family protein [Nocardioides faecalis]MBM9459299.1 MCE family protein [Nocardioides faecalis]QVI59577.1 MCE family protein [Nocardioides faecalis]